MESGTDCSSSVSFGLLSSSGSAKRARADELIVLSDDNGDDRSKRNLFGSDCVATRTRRNRKNSGSNSTGGSALSTGNCKRTRRLMKRQAPKSILTSNASGYSFGRKMEAAMEMHKKNCISGSTSTQNSVDSDAAMEMNKKNGIPGSAGQNSVDSAAIEMNKKNGIPGSSATQNSVDSSQMEAPMKNGIPGSQNSVDSLQIEMSKKNYIPGLPQKPSESDSMKMEAGNVLPGEENNAQKGNSIEYVENKIEIPPATRFPKQMEDSNWFETKKKRKKCYKKDKSKRTRRDAQRHENAAAFFVD